MNKSTKNVTPWRSNAVLTLLLAAASVPSGARSDTFDSQQQARVAQNPLGLNCTLRLADARTRYQQGETIRVTLAFSSNRPSTYRLNLFRQSRPSLATFATFYASPEE